MKKNIFLLLTVLGFGITMNAQTPPPPPQATVVTNLSSEQFKDMSTDTTATIIDLRTTKEIERGAIAGAIQIDYLGKSFDTQIAALDKNKTYYIYCQSGGRSGDAADMEKQGFKKIYNLEHGFSDWKTKGFPVKK